MSNTIGRDTLSLIPGTPTAATSGGELLLLGGLSTRSSPKRTMTPFELGRYLDYSSEMLSMISKTAAIYV